MNIEDMNQQQLTDLVKSCVDSHEQNKVVNPLYNDPEFREFVNKFESTMDVDSNKSWKRGLMITETDDGVYGLYLTSLWPGETKRGTQPVVKFKEIEKLYDAQVMNDLHKYLNR